MRKLITGLILSAPLVAMAAIKPFVSLDAGWSSFTNPDRVHHVSFDPTYPSDQYQDHSASNDGTVGITLGAHWQRQTQWLPGIDLGLRYQYYSTTISGAVDEFSLPQFHDYDYSYSVMANTLMLASKIYLVEFHHFEPFISGSLGISFNQATNYSEAALVSPSRVTPSMAGGMHSNRAYTFGAGIRYNITDYAALSLAWQYAHLGYVDTGAITTEISSATAGNTMRVPLQNNSIIAALTITF